MEVKDITIETINEHLKEMNDNLSIQPLTVIEFAHRAKPTNEQKQKLIEGVFITQPTITSANT